MTISQRIFEELKKQGKKQKDLADYIGLSTSAVSDWKKKGTNPSAEYISAIADFLEVSTDYLLTGADKISPINFQNSNVGNVGAVGHNISGTINIGSDNVSYENNFKDNHSDENYPILSDNDEMADELLRIFKTLPLKERTKIMTRVYELEDECSKKK